MAERNAANVLPEPVGAATNTCSPALSARPARFCASVGSSKGRENQGAPAGGKGARTRIDPPNTEFTVNGMLYILPGVHVRAHSLTLSQKHNILWSIAVPGPKARTKRESGANPELPRSGNW